MHDPSVSQNQPKQLKQFAVSGLIALLILAWITSGEGWTSPVAAGVGWFMVLLAWLAPAALSPIYSASMWLARPIGMVFGELALLTIYCTVFVPIGLAFRVIRREPLKRELARESSSYWQTSADEPRAKSYWRRY